MPETDDIVKWAEAFTAEKPKKTSKADSFKRAAGKLGVDPTDLASIVSFESGGSFDPHKVGGEGKRYRGLIQFGPEEQKRYYRPGQTFEDQLEDGVVRYFQDRFKKAGRQTAGASLEDLYTAVIAGNPGANRNAKDSFGTSARSGAARIAKEHRPKVLQDIFGGQPADDGNIWNEVDKVLQTPTASVTSAAGVTDDDALWSEVDQIIGKKPSVASTPTNPVQAPNITIEQTTSRVAPEAPSTLSAQLKSTHDPNSPKAATLVTDHKQVAQIPEELQTGLISYNTPQGLLFVNKQKADAMGVTDYPSNLSKLLGYVDDVKDTSKGTVLTALDQDGRELTSSIVTSPESTKAQAKVDRQMFPQTAQQKITNPQEVVTERLNNLLAPGDAQRLPSMVYLPNETPTTSEREDAQLRYQQFLKDTGLPDSPDAIKEFNTVQQAIGQQNKEAADLYNKDVQAQPRVSTRQLIGRMVQQPQTQQPEPSKEAVANVNWATGTGRSAKTFALDEAANQFANQLGVDYDTVREYLDAKGGVPGFTDEVAESRAKTRQETQLALDANAVAEVRKLQEERDKVKRRQAYQEATADEVARQYVEQGELESVAQLLAAKEVGIKEIKGRPIDDLIQEERDAYKRFSEQYTPTNAEIIAARASDLAQGLQTMEEARAEYTAQRQGQMREDVQKALKDYGSFSRRESEKQRIDEEYKYRPLARPLEFAKNFGSYVAKLPAKAVQAGMVLNEATIPGLISNEKPSDNPVWKWAEDYEKYFDDKKNKDFKDEFLVNELPEAFAQFATQAVLAPLSGGLSLTIPLAESGLAQYKEADKAGANKATRLAAAAIGALAGAPDVLIKAKFLKNLTPALKEGFIFKMADSLTKRFSRYMGQKEAEELSRVTLAGALKKGAFGFGAEYGQEATEDAINKAFAATYKPVSWSDFIPTEQERKGYLAAGIIGGFGGGVETVTQNLAYDELVNAESILDEALRSGKITSEQKAQAVAAAQKELTKREQDLSGEPDKERGLRPPVTYTDKKGNEFTLVEDRGDQVLVENEKGGQVVRNKEKLTPINETEAEVSPQPTSPQPEVLVRDQPVQSEVETVTRYHEKRPTGMVDEAPLRPETLTGAKERISELETEVQEERRKGTTDARTGLANQNAWEAAGKRIEADPNQEVISLDLNRMKEVNDTTSHTAVDKAVLEPLGAAVRKVLEKHGIDVRNAFRSGGDEFVVAVPKGQAQQIRDDTEKAFGTVEMTAEKDFTNTRTGESFKKGDVIPVTISGEIGNTVKDAEVALGKRKEASKAANPVRQATSELEPTFREATAQNFAQNAKIRKQKAWKMAQSLRSRIKNATARDNVRGMRAELLKWKGIHKEALRDEQLIAKPVSVGKKPTVVKTPEQKAVPAKAEVAEDVPESRITVGGSNRQYERQWNELKRFAKSSPLRKGLGSKLFDFRAPLTQELIDTAKRVGAKIPAKDLAKFAREQSAQSLGVAKEAQADESLQMKADPEAVSRFQEVQFAHTQTILEGAKSSIKDVEGSPSIELNEEAAELARRVWASAISKDVSPFYGATHTAAQLRRFAKEASKWAAHYESKGYTRDQVKALRKLANEFLTVANQAHGITYIFDESLPEETHHKMVLDLGGISTEAVNKLKQNPLWESKKFDRLYPNASPKVRAIELAAKLETGQDFWDDIDPKAKEEFLRIVADDIIDRNTVDGVLTLDTIQFERIIKYGSNLETGDTGGRREPVDRDTERTDELGREAGEGTRDRDTETDRGDGGRAAFEPDGKQKVSQTPKSLRGKADIPVADRTYTGVTNEGQQDFANQQLDKGIDDATQWFDENSADNNLNNGATAVVGLNLLNHYAKTQQFDKMNAVADKLVPMVTQAAQTVQAMATVSAFNPEMAAAYAAKVKKQKTGEGLTSDEAAQATRIATNLHETAQVDAAAEVALKQAERFIKDLEKDIEQANESIQTLTNDNQTIKVDLDEAKKTIRNQKAQITRLTNDKPRTPKAAMVKDLRKRKDDILTALAEKYGTPSLSMVAWHGSPHTFDKFDISKIGTGEGAQAYGYGLYFASSEEVADHYKHVLGERTVLLDGKPITAEHGQSPVFSWMQIHMMDGLTQEQAIQKIEDQLEDKVWLSKNTWVEPAIQKALPILKSGKVTLEKSGAKYRVELKPTEDEYLLWDKPLSEQSEKVKAATLTDEVIQKFDNLGITLADSRGRARLLSGSEFYQFLSRRIGSQKTDGKFGFPEPDGKATSEYLKSLGIRGIKYLDGSSRGKGEGNYNYVIFDDADVEILDSFQQAAEDPDLMDWAMLTLAENWSKMSVGEFYNLANQITNGQLTENEVRELHANAVDALRTNRSMDDDQKAAFKTRSEHLRTARKVRQQQMVKLFPKNKPESVNKTVSAIIRQGVEGNYSDDAIIFALIRKKHVNPDDAIKEFEKLNGAKPTKETLVDANRLTNDAKRAVIDERLQAKHDFKLTKQDIDLIREEQKFNRTVSGKAQRSAAKFYSGLSKTTYEVALQSIVNLRRANLLTGIKTHLRNISSNAMFQTSEEVSRPLAWLVDLAASGLTGERTVQGISPKAIAQSFNTLFREDETFKNLNKESGLKIAKNILLHGNTFEGMEKQQHERSVLGEKAGKLGKAFDAYVNKVFDTLGAEDAVFKTYAFRRSLEEQAKTMTKDKDERIKLITKPTNMMVQIASDYADFSTFTNDNALSNAIRRAKNMSPKAVTAIFETLVPYDRTPTNIVLRVIEHTPIGFVSAGKSLVNLKQAPSQTFKNKYRGAIELDLRSKDDFVELPASKQRILIDESLQKVFTRQQQQEFTRTFGRASMGSGVFGLGVFLAAAGLLTGAMSPEADDKDETKEFFKRREAGIENRSLLIPGIGRFVLTDDPVSKVLTAGATFYEQMLADRGAPVHSAWNGVKETAEDAIFEQPLLNSSNSMFRTIKGAKAGEFIGSLIGTTLIPTFVSDVAEVGDEKARTGSGFRPGEKSSILNPEFQGRGFRNTLLKRVPIARNYFVDEAQNTVPQEMRGGVLRRMVRAIDIFNTRPATEYQPLVAPDNEGYLKSPEGKRSTTDQLVTIIKYAKADGEDTKQLEQALKRKVKNAQKMGTFTVDEAKRVNDLLGTDFRPNEKAKRKP